MDNSQSASDLMRRARRKEKRNQAIENALGNVSAALSALDEAKEYIPVAGVGVVIPVLRSIVDHIRVSTCCYQRLCHALS